MPKTTEWHHGFYAGVNSALSILLFDGYETHAEEIANACGPLSTLLKHCEKGEADRELRAFLRREMRRQRERKSRRVR